MEQAWIEPTVEGQAEPESPAPVLALTGEAGGTAAGGDTDGASSETASDTGATATEENSNGSGLAVTALVVGALGLVTGIAGLGMALAARRRTS